MMGPTVKGILLSRALKDLRETAGKKQHEAAAALDCSPGKITHIENNRFLIKKTDLDVLLRYYDREDLTPVLEELRQGANEKGWWDTQDLPEWLASYIGLESDANLVRVFELELIPGLLQTEEYANALYSMSPDLLNEEISKRVNTRIKRQTRLIGSEHIPEVELHAIISTGAILRILNTDFAESQLRRIRDRAVLPNVTVQLLPFEEGLHRSMLGSFTILSFDETTQLPNIAYQANPLGGHIIDEQKVVSRYNDLHNELRDQALTPMASLESITETLQKLRRGTT